MNPTAELARQYIQKGIRVALLWPVVDGRCTCGEISCRSPGRHPRVVLREEDASEAVELDTPLGAVVKVGLAVLEVDGAEGRSNLRAGRRLRRAPNPATLTCWVGQREFRWFRATAAVPERVDLVLGLHLWRTGSVVPLPTATTGRWAGGNIHVLPKWLSRFSEQTITERANFRAEVMRAGGVPRTVAEVALWRPILARLDPEDPAGCEAAGLHLFDLSGGAKAGLTTWKHWAARVEGNQHWMDKWWAEQEAGIATNQALPTLEEVAALRSRRIEKESVVRVRAGFTVVTPHGDLICSPMDDYRFRVESGAYPLRVGRSWHRIDAVWDLRDGWWQSFTIMHRQHAALPASVARSIGSEVRPRFMRALAPAVRQRLQEPLSDLDLERATELLQGRLDALEAFKKVNADVDGEHAPAQDAGK